MGVFSLHVEVTELLFPTRKGKMTRDPGSLLPLLSTPTLEPLITD